MLIVGTSARLNLEDGREGVDDMFLEGTGAGSAFRDGSSGTLIVGTTGAVVDLERGRMDSSPRLAGLALASGKEISSLSSISFVAFQSFRNETIGRPGLSETAVGVGSLGLLSLSRNPVAARSSSLRISLPSFILTSGSFSSSNFADSSALVFAGTDELDV
jgi:hypothetical protein